MMVNIGTAGKDDAGCEEWYQVNSLHHNSLCERKNTLRQWGVLAYGLIFKLYQLVADATAAR